MRIVGGSLRGRPIRAPDEGTRPTSDRARQAVFNVLEHAAWSHGLEGARVLDLFAGSGALGLEALSRGVSFCLFVETGEAARGAIHDNLESLGLVDSGRIQRRDATDLGPRPGSAGEAFTLAFLDPPYGKGLGEPALSALRKGGWLGPEAICVLEQGANEPPVEVEGFEQLDQRRYGAAKVSFLRSLS